MILTKPIQPNTWMSIQVGKGNKQTKSHIHAHTCPHASAARLTVGSRQKLQGRFQRPPPTRAATAANAGRTPTASLCPPTWLRSVTRGLRRPFALSLSDKRRCRGFSCSAALGLQSWERLSPRRIKTRMNGALNTGW